MLYAANMNDEVKGAWPNVFLFGRSRPHNQLRPGDPSQAG
jgi:hypothetical protein